MQSLKIHITGNVYKTGMRYFLKQKAFLLKIKGCVFYQTDHSISVIAIGEKFNMDEFVKYCRNGNKESLIEDLSIRQNSMQKYDSFEVLNNNKETIA